MRKTNPKNNLSMYLGFAAVLIFAVSPAFTRTLAESLSTFTSGAIVNLAAGILMLIYRQMTCPLCPIRKTQPRYWLLCATTFIAFTLLCNIAIGLSATREIAVVSGLIRAMWPMAALLLNIPIGKAKARPALLLGVLACCCGVALANLSGTALSLSDLSGATIPMVLSFVSCLCWGLYSNYLPLTVSDPSEDYLPVITLIAGSLQLCGALIFHEKILHFGIAEIAQLLFVAVFTGFLANCFWNSSMQGQGRLKVILFSNLTPVLSTLLSALLLGLHLSLPIVLGALLVVVGTLWSKRCFCP